MSYILNLSLESVWHELCIRGIRRLLTSVNSKIELTGMSHARRKAKAKTLFRPQQTSLVCTSPFKTIRASLRLGSELTASANMHIGIFRNQEDRNDVNKQAGKSHGRDGKATYKIRTNVGSR